MNSTNKRVQLYQIIYVLFSLSEALEKAQPTRQFASLSHDWIIDLIVCALLGATFWLKMLQLF